MTHEYLINVFGIRGTPRTLQRIGARISLGGSGGPRGVPLMRKTEGFRS